MSEGINVGKVGSFGMGSSDYWSQIWQMMLSSRNGTFPLNVHGLSPPDPLSGIPFLLRVEPYEGGTPLRLYQDFPPVTPSTEDGENIFGIKQYPGVGTNLQGQGDACLLDLVSSGKPEIAFNGINGFFLLGTPVVLPGDFDLFVVARRVIGGTNLPLGNTLKATTCLLNSSNTAIIIDDTSNVNFQAVTVTTGLAGMRWTTISGLCKFEGTGQAQTSLGFGSPIGTLTIDNVGTFIGGSGQIFDDQNILGIWLTTETTHRAQITTYINSLYGSLFT